MNEINQQTYVEIQMGNDIGKLYAQLHRLEFEKIALSQKIKELEEQIKHKSYEDNACT